jgi:surface antigen
MKYLTMTKAWQLTTSLLLAALCLTLSAESRAAGGNLGFLKDAPITRFQGADHQLFESNTYTALDDNADGATRSWNNPKTGSSGHITILQTFEDKGRHCRSTQIVNQTRDTAAATNHFDFCKQADGRWVVAPEKRAQ